MKRNLIFFILAWACLVGVTAQEQTSAQGNPPPMKYYIIQSKFLKPFAEFREVVALHRAYLQTWYDKGAILCSGPKASKDGGVIIARARSDVDIEQLIAGDPYNKNQLAEYHFIEFVPVKRQALLEQWIE